MPYSVPDLPYDYDALEPHIDEATMQLHHDKHHQAYVDKVNAALEGTEWADKPIEEVLQNLDKLGDKATRRAQQRRRPLQPLAVLGVDEPGRRRRSRTATSRRRSTPRSAPSTHFKAQIKDAGVNRFGSGWSWLVHDGSGLAVVSTREPGQPDLRRADAAAGRRRLGARLLPEVPEPAPGLHRRLVERRELAARWRSCYAAASASGRQRLRCEPRCASEVATIRRGGRGRAARRAASGRRRRASTIARARHLRGSPARASGSTISSSAPKIDQQRLAARPPAGRARPRSSL